MIQKSDLTIEFNGYKFVVKVKKKFFLFFHKWETLTSREAENLPEQPIEFDSLAEAIDFIELVTP